MERLRSMQRLVLVAVLLSQTLLAPVVTGVGYEDLDQKNFFYPDPNTITPPIVSYSPPATPSPTPVHGGPPGCGTPPSGGHHATNPSPPGGGGYYHSPPRSNPAPPTTPTVTIPSPPSDPNSPPFTCTYWKNHPALIWGLFGWWGNVGNAFGVSNVPGVGANMNLVQALSNTRNDGYGEICREGTAALLNAMAHAKFPYTTAQVRDRFAAALASDKAAAAQARLFKLANEGKINPRDHSSSGMVLCIRFVS